MSETEEYAKTLAALSTDTSKEVRARRPLLPTCDLCTDSPSVHPAVYDHATAHAIIDAAPVVHVSFNPSPLDDDPFPTILPMIGCTGSYTAPGAAETSAVAIYLHGHAGARLMCLRDTPSDAQPTAGLPGAPVASPRPCSTASSSRSRRSTTAATSAAPWSTDSTRAP
jgi:hypothetical protein